MALNNIRAKTEELIEAIRERGANASKKTQKQAWNIELSKEKNKDWIIRDKVYMMQLWEKSKRREKGRCRTEL